MVKLLPDRRSVTVETEAGHILAAEGCGKLGVPVAFNVVPVLSP
jgi:hypothetical protein